MKTPPSPSLFDLDFFAPLPIHIEASDSPLTTDAGLLPLRQFDERIGLTKQFAAALPRPLRTSQFTIPPAGGGFLG